MRERTWKLKVPMMDSYGCHGGGAGVGGGLLLASTVLQVLWCCFCRHSRASRQLCRTGHTLPSTQLSGTALDSGFLSLLISKANIIIYKLKTVGPGYSEKNFTNIGLE